MTENKDKVCIMTFTDPMMGLSYECEPIFRKLETHYGENIEFKYVMSVLVQYVYYFVDKNDMAEGKDVAIKRYNARLSKIYESEEVISGMPINMTSFNLFSIEHTSSIPLNLAYKAAQLVDEKKADLFLYNLRYSTIVDCKPTTRLEEILKVVRKTDIDTVEFLNYYNDGTAQKMLDDDLRLKHGLGIYSLPAYLIKYRDKSFLVQSLIGYNDFVDLIFKITDGVINPQCVTLSTETLMDLVDKHPLISPIEIQEAFDLQCLDEVREFINPLIETNELEVIDVYHGWFLKKIK